MMASTQSVATGSWDNESKLEQDHKREVDQRRKWAHGEAFLAPGRPSKRPLKAPSQR